MSNHTTSTRRKTTNTRMEEQKQQHESDTPTRLFVWHDTFADRSVWSRRLRWLLLPFFGIRLLGIVLRSQALRPFSALGRMIAHMIGRDSTFGRLIPVDSCHDFSVGQLTRLLQHQGILHEMDAVLEFTIEPLGGRDTDASSSTISPSVKSSRDSMSSMNRLIIKYYGSSHERLEKYPKSFICKETPKGAILEAFTSVFDIAALEFFIYSGRNFDLHSKLNRSVVSIPQSFGAEWHEWTGKGWILMEDLQPKTGSPFTLHLSRTDLSSKQVYSIIDGLFEFHQTMRRMEEEHHAHIAAGTVALSPLYDYPLTLRGDDHGPGLMNWIWQESDKNFLFLLAGRGWINLRDALHHPMSTELTSVGEWLFSASTCGIWSLQSMWRKWHTKRPYFFSIAHGDVHTQNCFFGNETRPLVLCDFQVCRYRARTSDLAYFVLGSFSADMAQQYESEMLRRYFNQIPEIKCMNEHEKAGAWLDWMALYHSTLLFTIFSVIGIGSTIHLRAWKKQNEAVMQSGDILIALSDFFISMGGSLVEVVNRAESLVHRHRLYHLTQAWRRTRNTQNESHWIQL